MKTKTGRLDIAGDRGDFYITLVAKDETVYRQIEHEDDKGEVIYPTLAEYVAEVNADEDSVIKAYFGKQPKMVLAYIQDTISAQVNSAINLARDGFVYNEDGSRSYQPDVSALRVNMALIQSANVLDQCLKIELPQEARSVALAASNETENGLARQIMVGIAEAYQFLAEEVANGNWSLERDQSTGNQYIMTAEYVDPRTVLRMMLE